MEHSVGTSVGFEREPDAVVKYRRVKRVAGGMFAALALAGLAFFVRSFPDLRRYLRIKRM